MLGTYHRVEHTIRVARKHRRIFTCNQIKRLDIPATPQDTRIKIMSASFYSLHDLNNEKVFQAQPVLSLSRKSSK